MDTTVITTGHLLLRPWEVADAPAVLTACQDAEVQRWTTVPSPYTHEDALQWVQERAPQGWVSGVAASFAVLDATTGELLGSVSLALHGAAAEVGYWVSAAARGRGVASEALSAVCRWAFGGLGVERVTWQAYVGNWASKAVAERCGFTVEAVARHGLLQRGVWRDGWTGRLLATDETCDRRSLPSQLALADELVGLRRWRSEDAADVARACDDPLTARWLPVPSPYLPADGTAYVEQLVPAQWSEGRAANVAVVDRATGELLGAVSLDLLQRPQGVGEVGYWTAPWARGQGVAGRAAALLAGWGLAELGLARIGVFADVDNVAAQRAAARGGFQREGIARRSRRNRDGTARDMVVFSRVHDDA